MRQPVRSLVPPRASIALCALVVALGAGCPNDVEPSECAPGQDLCSGFCVDTASPGGRATVTPINLNDQTVEGMRVDGVPAFSVQYHPEAGPGPHDAKYLFAMFAAMMRDHGHIGRLYAGDVTQIISGSIGFDDWEWGVDLFADDPIVFKKLIYEMRFDEASADYGEFGPVYTGVQFSASEVGNWVEGRAPQFPRSTPDV